MSLSFGGPGGISRAPSATIRHGYAGQINDAPFVLLLPAAGLTRTQATARGAVNPNFLPTTARFDYGLTTTYGNATLLPDLAANTVLETVTSLLDGLAPGAIYHFRLVAANADGAVRSADATFITVANLAPLAQADSIQRRPDRTIKMAVAALLGNDSDPENDPVRLKTFDAQTTQGGTVTLDSGWLIYTPPASANDTSTFTYTIEDSFGATAVATVTVLVTSAEETGPGQNIALIYLRADGKTVVRFAGVPGRPFRVKWTDSLEAPASWNDGPVLTVGPNGLFEYVDYEPPSSTGRRFYRVTPSQP
ncbi:MAG: cadherin-like domain-containing protein [Chloroflexi bacterium]|nr:cadherin-like domain-containing protein [Chloroflexota bacterium]